MRSRLTRMSACANKVTLGCRSVRQERYDTLLTVLSRLVRTPSIQALGPGLLNSGFGIGPSHVVQHEIDRQPAQHRCVFCDDRQGGVELDVPPQVGDAPAHRFDNFGCMILRLRAMTCQIDANPAHAEFIHGFQLIVVGCIVEHDDGARTAVDVVGQAIQNVAIKA